VRGVKGKLLRALLPLNFLGYLSPLIFLGDMYGFGNRKINKTMPN